MSRSVQPLILKDQCGFDEGMMGSVLSAQFAFGGFANAFLLEPLVKLLGGRASLVVKRCVLIMSLLFVFEAVTFTEQLAVIPVELRAVVFVAFALLRSMFQFSLSTSITAETTGVVPAEMQGTLMGIEHATFCSCWHCRSADWYPVVQDW